jgi:hypothetical protein
VPRVYIETTIPSYLAARSTSDVILAARQCLTHAWWNQRRHVFQCCISQLVLDEAARGDAAAATRRLALLKPFPLLELNGEVSELAERLLIERALPAKAADDAAHIAVSAVHRVNFLLTWNFRHIANAETREEVRRVCVFAGYGLPVICTPEELLGGKL